MFKPSFAECILHVSEKVSPWTLQHHLGLILSRFGHVSRGQARVRQQPILQNRIRQQWNKTLSIKIE